MRLWSLHPKWLDSKGLVALWREALLAQKVLQNKTRGYKNHPQLIRFKESMDPLGMICAYLQIVWKEADKRGYLFDRNKIGNSRCQEKLPVSEGQLEFEWIHLKRKLAKRDPEKLKQNLEFERPTPHDIFNLVPGRIASWEKDELQ